MGDLPSRIAVNEEGPREGFQIETAAISTNRKVELIEALSATGVPSIQVCSFVNPKLVPGWADADDVVAQMRTEPGVAYTALWFNNRGIQRALAHKDKLTLSGCIHLCASEAFSIQNLHRDRDANIRAMHAQTADHQHAGIAVTKISVMAAFGCNFQADVPVADVLQSVEDGLSIAAAHNATITEVALADTMGWASPRRIQAVIGAVRERWPELPIRLHLHDTRGLGISNAWAAMQLGVSRFDTTVGGLGGCPFARQPGASGNIATEELVLLAHEEGITTGIDLDALLECAALAESIVGHPLPGALLRGGSLNSYRQKAQSGAHTQ
jgi:hydroxymethylglutaryl-CoA lyase